MEQSITTPIPSQIATPSYPGRNIVFHELSVDISRGISEVSVYIEGKPVYCINSDQTGIRLYQLDGKWLMGYIDWKNMPFFKINNGVQPFTQWLDFWFPLPSPDLDKKNKRDMIVNGEHYTWTQKVLNGNEMYYIMRLKTPIPRQIPKDLARITISGVVSLEIAVQAVPELLISCILAAYVLSRDQKNERERPRRRW